MNKNSPPSEWRARMITTHEGKFINVQDIKVALMDDQFVQEQMMMLVIARDHGHSHVEGIRRVIGGAIASLSGDLERILSRQAIQESTSQNDQTKGPGTCP